MEDIITKYSLIENKIEELPEEICKHILEDAKEGHFQKNQCHLNSYILAQQMKYKNVENKIVEGVVRLENGFLFEHYWNKFIYQAEAVSYFDISLGVLGSDIEKKTPKTYYEYKTLSVQEMESKTSFSDEILSLIEMYYESYPEHSAKYYKNKKTIDGGE